MEKSPADPPEPPATLPAERTSPFNGDTRRGLDHELGFEANLGFLQPPGRPDSLGRVGHYEVLEVLGRGGFGTVFRAFDTVLERVVAIKVLAPEMAATSPARKRFLREARAAAQVRHENVVPIHAVEERPLPYLVMDDIPGETLQQRLDRSGPMGVAETVAVGRQVAEGLAAAHAAGLIHRDVKPANVLIEAGPRLRLKITDFGLARAADDASLTQSGLITGTPMYMSPEQARGDALDHRTDLFSLGSVLYQMAAGRPPFRADSTMAVLKRVAEDPPRPIREIIPETPPWLCDVIANLHAKDPDDRFQSAREVADLLAECEARLQAKRGLSDLIPARKPGAPTRWKLWVAVAALVPVLALVVAEAVGITHLFRGPGPPGPAANPGTPDGAGWVPLFNGTDLTGWKTHPDQPGDWRVENGALVGRGPLSNLFSERGDYRDFHVRLEARVNGQGDSGLYFRTEYGATRVSPSTKLKYPNGYEAQILGAQITTDSPTGSLVGGPFAKRAPPSAVPADTWFTLEVIARDSHLEVRVNDQVTADVRDSGNTYRQGHLALQCGGVGRTTQIHVRKVEIKELPPD
jgi:hypothetical protein